MRVHSEECPESMDFGSYRSSMAACLDHASDLPAHLTQLVYPSSPCDTPGLCTIRHKGSCTIRHRQLPLRPTVSESLLLRVHACGPLNKPPWDLLMGPTTCFLLQLPGPMDSSFLDVPVRALSQATVSEPSQDFRCEFERQDELPVY